MTHADIERPGTAESAATLDPQVAELIARVEEAELQPANSREITVAERRASAVTTVKLFQGPDIDGRYSGVQTEDLHIPSSDPGHRVPARLYRPPATNPTQDRRRSHAIVFIHGGGWVAGSVDSYDYDARHLAVSTGATVISVEYRLAPEYPYPAALDDCLTVVQAVRSRKEFDSLSIAGDSAGGSLALASALVLPDKGISLAAQLLIYPALDPEAQSNVSYATNGKGFLLTAGDMAFYWRSYLGGDGSRHDYPGSPRSAPYLGSLPPTVLVTAGFDPLRDEGRDFAKRLIDSDVPLVYLPNPTLTHGFQQMAPRIESAALAIERAYREFLALIELNTWDARQGKFGDA